MKRYRYLTSKLKIVTRTKYKSLHFRLSWTELSYQHIFTLIAQLVAERLWPWSWELWTDAITETLILPHRTLVWVGFLGQIMEKTFCCKYRANGINELASLLTKLNRLRDVKPEGM